MHLNPVKKSFVQHQCTKLASSAQDNDSIMFRNKRSQAKGVYYVFLYKQHMDNVYTVHG